MSFICSVYLNLIGVACVFTEGRYCSASVAGHS